MIPRPDIYYTYWYFAAERQNIFYKRLDSAILPPYTDDPILSRYKFCNTYRAADRVSQFLICNVIYGFETNPENVLFRIFLFRLLNKIETWKYLEGVLGQITLANFNHSTYSEILTRLRVVQPIYGNAFILCANKSFGFEKKQDNHLALLSHVFATGMVARLLEAPTLQDLFLRLRELPLIGDFMAYQLAIDFTYSPLYSFGENDYTVAGPGALRGIQKCFLDIGSYSPADIISYMVDSQEKEFSRMGLRFKALFGRPLHAIDAQGLFCETDKYCRVRFPELASNRSRIKSTFTATSKPIDYFFPPKWGINHYIPNHLTE
jgi:hypothetical protein